MRTKRVYLNERPTPPVSAAQHICANCRKVRGWEYPARFIRFEHDEASEQNTEFFEYTGQVYATGRWYGGNLFCTLRCCESFAKAAVMAGYVKGGRRWPAMPDRDDLIVAIQRLLVGNMPGHADHYETMLEDATEEALDLLTRLGESIEEVRP